MTGPAQRLAVVILGTGGTAFQLAHALCKSNRYEVHVTGRNAEHAKRLADEVGASFSGLNDTPPPADVYLIAVKDEAIAEVAAHIPRGNSVVAHTAGAQDMELLSVHAHRGVLWPLQTLSRHSPQDLSGVPIVVEANDAHALDLLDELTGSISGHCVHADAEHRQLLHLAAVFASNFPVILMEKAQDLLRDSDLDPALLLPLWRTMAANVERLGAHDALTGPAKRGDTGTMVKHGARLAHLPDLRRIHDALNELIGVAHPPQDDGR